MGNRISIYDYIVNSIKKDGMLPKEFCLDRYFTDEQDFLFDLGVYDGMLFFLTEKNVNKGFYYFIIKLFRTVKEDNIPLYCALIDNYISEEKDNDESGEKTEEKQKEPTPIKTVFKFNDDLLDFSEDKISLYLVYNRQQIYCFPKRCLSEDVQNTVREHLTKMTQREWTV